MLNGGKKREEDGSVDGGEKESIQGHNILNRSILYTLSGCGIRVGCLLETVDAGNPDA